MSRHRNWMITIFNEEEFNNGLSVIKHTVDYVCGQWELCPTTKKKHFQGYIEINKPMTMYAIKKLIKTPTAHLEPRLGTQEQAISYCTKDDTSTGERVEWGEKKQQGKRTDLEIAIDLAEQNIPICEIIHENPKYLRYMKYLKEYQQDWIALHPMPREPPTVEVLIGETGSGKTRYVEEKEEILYKVQETSSNTMFFDGYQGQEAVLIDDFKGNIRFNFLLQLLDRYNLRVNTKGGTTNWCPKRIYITSNYEPHEWYPNLKVWEIAPLLRRITAQKLMGNTVPSTSPITTFFDDVI